MPASKDISRSSSPAPTASGRPERNPYSLERWEADWQREAKRPEAELSTAVPKELQAAARNGWLPRGGKVLDIGCGRGQVTAWLAGQGFRAVGIDLAPSAIALARRDFGNLPAVEFMVADICAPPFGEAQFDALIDRNCLHVLGKENYPRYVSSVARMAKEGASLFVFFGIGKGSTAKDVLARVQGLFKSHFRLAAAKPTAEPLTRSAGPIPRWRVPGIAFRLIRLPAVRG